MGVSKIYHGVLSKIEGGSEGGKVLKSALLTGLISMTPAISTTKAAAENVISSSYDDKYVVPGELFDSKNFQESTRNVGLHQVGEFCRVLNITSSEQFIKYVRIVQKESGIDETGSLNWETMFYTKKRIYTPHISKGRDTGTGIKMHLYNEIPNNFQQAKEKDNTTNVSIAETKKKTESNVPVVEETVDPIEKIWESSTAEKVEKPKKTTNSQAANILEKKRNQQFIKENRDELRAFLKQYSKHPRRLAGRTIYPGKVPSADSNNYFYGRGLGRNKPSTYLNKRLYDKIGTKKFINSDDFIYVGKHKGQPFLQMYVDGKQEVLTPITIGGSKHKSPENKILPIMELSKYHVSSNHPNKPGIKNDGGAVMPLGIRLTGYGIFIHARYMGHSHGCFGVPLLFQKRIYELLESSSNRKKIKVTVGDLY